jgi:hypothetical protein
MLPPQWKGRKRREEEGKKRRGEERFSVRIPSAEQSKKMCRDKYLVIYMKRLKDFMWGKKGESAEASLSIYNFVTNAPTTTTLPW